ncbi:gamma-aminobutyric acid receptor subunit beta-like [Octopus sinensis]|uniref:Gamma-aminobutyric acid receptor subunit beta n=1 Tax=Octopus sinensis TaxID=2607531 RepID=A0A6P7STF7_9MOLL|nr:gamma-aminobutyric acid receptor subunit beta-like [Octopus sinensis]
MPATTRNLVSLVFLSVILVGSYGTSSRFDNATNTIKALLKGYDIRLRPQFGVQALRIGMEIIIASFDSISEVNMDYTITLYLNQYWIDERLVYSNNSDDNLTLTGDFAENIWVPDTFFANDKNSFLHDITEKNKMIRLFGNGSIVYGMRFTTTLACMMDLHYYPLDVQNCTVEVESYGYTMVDVIMYWRNGKDAVMGVDRVELPQFDIKEYKTVVTIEKLTTGNYQRLSLSFKLQRNIGYFIFQTYLPSILIVMLSWVSFWINHEATSARVALGITTVLTMTTISNGVRSSLPRISYVKAIDIYLVMCFVFVFAALLEYAAVNYTYWGGKAKRKAKKLREKNETLYDKDDNENRNDVSDNIELRDLRLSPILGIRNTQNFNIDVEENSNTSPSIHLGSSMPRAAVSRSYIGNNLIRRKSASGALPRRRKLFTHFRQKAKNIKAKIPRVQDVNTIDKYARLMFPLLFIIFNASYWAFYLMQ